MAFVTCEKFNRSQEEQDNEIKRLVEGAISADENLLDKSSGSGGGKVTVEKIKESLVGRVEISVKEKSGIIGDGTKSNPLSLNLGNSFRIDSKGKIEANVTNIANIRLVDASGNHILGHIIGE